MKVAFYWRVSTEDAQDPESSRAWQRRRAEDLVRLMGGTIVQEYSDIGQSRSVAWQRRPGASQLLNDLKNPDRGFSAVVIGEPQRAFSGNQYSLTFPLFVHFGVDLLVPEVGGRVDPDSEAHDMLMNLFGGMSKGERGRIRTRVKASMAEMAETTDRHLGGRPPYGYRLADAGPHPNPSKSAAGQRLHKLEPDPVTAMVVPRIFHMFAVQCLGLRTIADILTAEGIPSPSAHDPDRNTHRDPRGWCHTAIRTILKNERYLGYRVWGKQEKYERLIDTNNVGEGYKTQMRWRDPSDWVVRPDNRTHEPLVDQELWNLASARLKAGSRGTPRPRTAQHDYCLRGLLFCARCGKRMAGSWHANRTPGSGRILYRCEIRKNRSLPPDLGDHPLCVDLREDAVLPHLDRWIQQFADAAWLASSQRPDPATLAKRSHLMRQLAEVEKAIESLVKAIEGGATLDSLVTQLERREAERDELRLRIAQEAPSTELTAAEITELVERFGGLAKILPQATASERMAIYADLGVRMEYDHTTKQVRATAQLGACVAKRVGGGT